MKESSNEARYVIGTGCCLRIYRRIARDAKFRRSPHAAPVAMLHDSLLHDILLHDCVQHHHRVSAELLPGGCMRSVRHAVLRASRIVRSQDHLPSVLQQLQ